MARPRRRARMPMKKLKLRKMAILRGSGDTTKRAPILRHVSLYGVPGFAITNHWRINGQLALEMFHVTHLATGLNCSSWAEHTIGAAIRSAHAKIRAVARGKKISPRRVLLATIQNSIEKQKAQIQ